jgi:hypothetical protein
MGKKPWIQQLVETLTGMSPDELKVVQLVIAVLIGIGTIVTSAIVYGLVWFYRARALLDDRNGIDRTRLYEIYVIIEERPDGRHHLCIETPAGERVMLCNLLGNDKITRKARSNLPSTKPGDCLLPMGEDRAHVMERLKANVSGGDAAATAAALDGRHGDYDRVKVAYLFTRFTDESGTDVPTVIYIGRKVLRRFEDLKYRDKLTYERYAYADLVPILEVMAAEYTLARTHFKENVRDKHTDVQRTSW